MSEPEAVQPIGMSQVISLRLLLSVLTVIVIPLVAGGVHMNNVLSDIRYEIRELRRDFLYHQQESVHPGAISRPVFRAWIREARALNESVDFPDLLPE